MTTADIITKANNYHHNHHKRCHLKSIISSSSCHNHHYVFLSSSSSPMSFIAKILKENNNSDDEKKKFIIIIIIQCLLLFNQNLSIIWRQSNHCRLHSIFKIKIKIKIIIILLLLFNYPTFIMTNEISSSSKYNHHHNHSNGSSSNVMDLVVNVEENVLLECNHNDDDGSLSYQYIWCRYELTNDWSIQSNQSLLFNQIDHTTNKKVNEKIAVDNQQRQQQKNKSNTVNHQTCFNGDRYLIVNENHISTIIYRCEIRQQQQTNSILLDRKIFKLYVDQFSIVHSSNRRAVREISRKLPGSKKIQYRPNCYHSAPPRCKPYATVEYAQCTRIELKIRYPTNQYGYNHSIDYWGTINCNDNDVIGYQLWLIGYGIVKKFRSNERIIMNNLIPGKRYCFNGWAYNSCGRGPVFTLEGVCAINNQDCHVKSDEHCELDVDYSW